MVKKEKLVYSILILAQMKEQKLQKISNKPFKYTTKYIFDEIWLPHISFFMQTGKVIQLICTLTNILFLKFIIYFNYLVNHLLFAILNFMQNYNTIIYAWYNTYAINLRRHKPMKHQDLATIIVLWVFWAFIIILNQKIQPLLLNLIVVAVDILNFVYNIFSSRYSSYQTFSFGKIYCISDSICRHTRKMMFQIFKGKRTHA